MHPFSLTDEQIEQVSGAHDYWGDCMGPMPGMITWGIGETGQYPSWAYEQER